MKMMLFMMLLISNYVFAHGNIDNKNGACTLKISEEHSIHLTAYQPSTHEGEVFCQDAPDLVETIMVLDFMEEDSKKLPFAFSLAYMNDGELEPLNALPFALYPQGSMLFKFIPKAVGKYHAEVKFIDKDGHDTTSDFDFYVGQKSPNSREPTGTQQVVKWLVIMLVVLGVFYMIYTKRVNRERDAD